MRVALTVPYADVRAADLVLAIDAPVVAPLQALELSLGSFAVELGVLGHSHQVVLRGPGVDLVERVACAPGAEGDLPPARELARDGHRYAFRASVQALEEDALDLARRVAADPHGLVGVFAGAEEAFTGLRVERVDGGVRWETWHAYPQTGELVATTGTVRAA